MFEIVGDTSQAASLAETLAAGNLAGQLSAQLSQEYNMNITVEVSGGTVAESSEQRPEGEVWEEVNGEYLIRACPQGFLLVNTTVEQSMCKECDPGTYSLSYVDRCSPEQQVCDKRDCTPCAAGAFCAKGSEPAWKHFVPKAVEVSPCKFPIPLPPHKRPAMPPPTPAPPRSYSLQREIAACTPGKIAACIVSVSRDDSDMFSENVKPKHV